MVKTKEISLDFRRRTVNAHRGGEGYTRLSKRFQVSRTAVRSIIKKFEETSTVENKTGRGRKQKISKLLERKLVREDQQILRSLRDLLRRNGLRHLRRHA